jgi:hypothetical protein
MRGSSLGLRKIGEISTAVVLVNVNLRRKNEESTEQEIQLSDRRLFYTQMKEL